LERRNLHVSLPADIIQLIGTSSVPVVVAGTVLGVSELGERLASQRAKDALSKWLVSFDVRKAAALPEGTQELFERIFGERHFSLKCFVRSAAFSMGAMAFIVILLLLISPKDFLEMKDAFLTRDLAVGWENFVLWLPWSIFIDYLSLFKTRFILGLLTRMRRRNTTISIAILVIDYIVYRVLFALAVTVVIIVVGIVDGVFTFQNAPNMWILGIDLVKGIFSYISVQGTIPHDIELWLIFFWSGFVPSIWMWLYVAALFVTRSLLRSEKLVNRLRWLLDVEKSPFRSIGAVAAALAFVASVAIILVSAEVSRISAAA
jgi:hypothetical protein